MNPRKWCLFPQKKWLFTLKMNVHPKICLFTFCHQGVGNVKILKTPVMLKNTALTLYYCKLLVSCVFPSSAFSNTITGAAGVPPGPKFCSTTCAQIDEEFGHLGRKQKTWKPRNGLCVKSKIYEMWCQVVEEQHLKMPSSLRWYTCN